MEKIELSKTQVTSQVYNASNYYFNGSKSVNTENKEVESTWFVNTDIENAINGGITRNLDGTINMRGFLVLTDQVPEGTGARVAGMSSGIIIVTPEPVPDNNDDNDDDDYQAQVPEKEDLGDTTGTWIKDDKGWWYSKADKTYPENNWLKVNGKWYHFNTEGYMNTGWQMVGNKWYLLNQDGAMETGWQKVDNKWYLLNDDGDMATGWQLVDNKWYLLNDNGDMATGWQFVNNKWYFLHANGDMAANTVIDGYPVDESGAWIEEK